MAQVGVDITQFKRGLDEADARMRLSALRFTQSGKQVERMTQAAQHMEDSANAKRMRAKQILVDQAKIEKEIEYSQRRASDTVKTASRISAEKSAAQTQVKALQQSGAAYTNLTAQRNALSKAESNAAALAKQAANAQTKHAATSLVLATALQKKRDEHAQAQTEHAQGLARAQQKHADETIKQQQKVAQVRKIYLDEYEKSALTRENNIANAKNRVSQLEGQYNVAHRRADVMAGETAARNGGAGISQSVQDAMIAQHDKVERLGRQLIQARANAAQAALVPLTLPKSSDKLSSEQAKLQTLLHMPPAESAKTFAVLDKATKSLRDMEVGATKSHTAQNNIVQSLQHQHAVAEANKLVEEQKLAALVHGNAEYAKLVEQQKIVASTTRASVTAQRELDSEVSKQIGLEKQLEGIKTRIASLNTRAAQQSRSAVNLSTRAGETSEMAQARLEAENAYAMRKKQDAESHRTRAANAVSGAFIGAGAVGIGALAVGEKTGADFNQMMVTAQHNTSLTNAQIKDMVATIKELGMQSGASFDELADSYRKIENVGFKANQISEVLTPAMKAAVAQGADLAETTQLLVSTMRSYQQPASKAGETMNSLVAISKVANLRLGEMVKVFGFGAVNAGIYKISLAELGAAFATATDLGLDSHRVITQLNGLMVKTANPTKKMLDSINDLDARARKVSTGWNLGKKLSDDFGYGGQKAKTLLGIIEDIKKASSTLKVDPLEAITKIYNQRQGQAVAGILAGPGADRFKENLATVRSHIKEEQDEKDYQAALKQTNRQMDILRNHFVVLASSIDDAFAPSIKKAIGYVDGLLKHFNSLNESTKTGVFDTVAIGGAALILGGIFGKIITGIGALKVAFVELGMTANAAMTAASAVALIPATIGAGAFLGTALRMKYLPSAEEQTADAEKRAMQRQFDTKIKYAQMGRKALKAEIDKTRQAIQNSAVSPDETTAFNLSNVKEQDKLRAQLAVQKDAYGMISSGSPQSQAQKDAATAAADFKRLYGHKRETPGADPLAGLGDKAKKAKRPKTPKESEHDQMVDSYVSAMEQLKEAEYTTMHKDMGSNEISARWATMSHGIVNADGEARKLSGAYMSMSSAEKQAYIEGARHNDMLVKQKEQLEALNSLLESNRPKLTVEQDPTGKQQILEDMSDGKYKKMYGSHAAEAIQSDVDAGARAQKKRIDEKTDAALEESQAKSMRNTAESAKAYSNALETARDALQRLQDEGREIGGHPATYLDAANRSIADRNKDKSSNWLQAAMDEQLRDIAKRTDAKKIENAETQRSITLTDYLANAEERARDAAITARNPNDKAGEYRRQAIQTFGPEKFNQLSPADRAAKINEINDSYKKVSADAREAEASNIVADALKRVNDQFGNTHNTLVTNITDWNKLTGAQKDYLNQLQKLSDAKQRVQDALSGITDIISKSLDDLHEHGFRNFFRDVANEFQNMIYEMGKKWVMAQITKTVQNGLTGVLGKAYGVPGGQNTLPAAPSSGMSGIGSVDTITISNASNITISGAGGSASGASSGSGGSQQSSLQSALQGVGASGGSLMSAGMSVLQAFGPALGKMFGPGAAPSASSLSDAMTSVQEGAFDDAIAGSFANGGTMFSDHSYLVGEQGPEIVHPMSSGQVVPMNRGATTVNIHVHGVTDAGSFNQSKHQITQDMTRAVQMAQRR